MRALPVLLPLLVLCGGAPLSGQTVTQLSSGPGAYNEAKVSPDGRTVAFRATGRIGVVPYQGGTEFDLAVGAELGTFLWARSSIGLYYLDGDVVRFVGRSGGGSSTVATLTAQRPRLWCVNEDDTVLYGTRFHIATATERIFSVDTSGQFAPIDLVVANPQTSLGEVCIDPSGSFLVYREALAFPFPPVEFFRVDIDGSNPVSLTGGPIAEGYPENVAWLDAGNTIAFTITSQLLFRPQIARIGPSGTTVDLLTEGFDLHRRSVVTADRSSILHEATYATGGGLASGPAIVPAEGGGVVPLAADDEVVYAMQGLPSADDSGDKIAFVARVSGGLPQIYAVETDRDLRVAPRVVVGGSFNVDLPLRSTEIALVFLGALSVPALPLPGFSYGLTLDPTSLVVIGAGSGADLSIPLSVPRRRVLRGQELWVQALRTEAVGGGGFTRYAHFRIF